VLLEGGLDMRLEPSAAQIQIAKASTWLLPHTCTRLEPSASLTQIQRAALGSYHTLAQG